MANSELFKGSHVLMLPRRKGADWHKVGGECGGFDLKCPESRRCSDCDSAIQWLRGLKRKVILNSGKMWSLKTPEQGMLAVTFYGDLKTEGVFNCLEVNPVDGIWIASKFDIKDGELWYEPNNFMTPLMMRFVLLLSDEQCDPHRVWDFFKDQRIGARLY